MKRRWLGLVMSFAIAGSAAALAPRPEAAPRWLGPYAEVSDSSSAVSLARIPSAHLRSAVLAFVVARGRSCTPAWDGAGPVARHPFGAAITRLQHAHVQTMLSFGGQSGRELALTCQTPQALAAAYASAAHAYRIERLDFDLEQGGLAPGAVARRAAAMRLMQQQDPRVQISLTLPVSTKGLPPEAVRPVRVALHDGVRLAAVNVMAMDFGDSDAPHPRGRMAFYIERAAVNAHRQLARLGLPWRRLAVTVMVGRNDTRSEFVSLSDARAIAAFARAHELESLRYWSWARDPHLAYANALAGRRS